MQVFFELQRWGARRYFVALAAGLGWLFLSGLPTEMFDTPLFTRMTPVVWWDYPFWAIGAVLVGLLTATYVPDRAADQAGGSQRGKALSGGLLSVFVIGCPVCNKLVVLALGAGGALTYFAPVQPLLGLLSVGLLLYALRVQLVDGGSCSVDRIGAEGVTR